jgi:hypothetical protein
MRKQTGAVHLHRLRNRWVPLPAGSVRILMMFATVARVLDQATPYFVGIPAPGGFDIGLDHRVEADLRRRQSQRATELIGIGRRSSADQLADGRFD